MFKLEHVLGLIEERKNKTVVENMVKYKWDEKPFMEMRWYVGRS